MDENIFEFTPEEEFRMKFGMYFPELKMRLETNTITEEFNEKTREMAELAAKAGIDFKEYSLEYLRQITADESDEEEDNE